RRWGRHPGRTCGDPLAKTMSCSRLTAMKIGGIAYRTIWLEPDGWSVGIIDQTRLPHAFVTLTLRDVGDAVRAIRDLEARGGPLIGAPAAYGRGLAARTDPGDAGLDEAVQRLAAARPTAVNLRWALERMRDALRNQPPAERGRIAYEAAGTIADEDVETN